jgi:hypothetical protein
MSIEEQFDTFEAASKAAKEVAVKDSKMVDVFRQGQKWVISYDEEVVDYYEEPYIETSDVDDELSAEERRLYEYDDEKEMRYWEYMEDTDAYTQSEEDGWYYDD